MIDKNKKIVKADQFIAWDFDDNELEKKERLPTEFEYLKAQVDALYDVVSILQLIIKQNNLVYKTEDDGQSDIEDEAWKKLEEQE